MADRLITETKDDRGVRLPIGGSGSEREQGFTSVWAGCVTQRRNGHRGENLAFFVDVLLKNDQSHGEVCVAEVTFQVGGEGQTPSLWSYYLLTLPDDGWNDNLQHQLNAEVWEEILKELEV